jgi:hypothetical protein
MKIDKLQAIVAINPNAKVCVESDDYEKITWNDTPIISLADIEAKQAELQPIEDAREQKIIDDAKNGNQKLLDLGLTQDEVTAMTGYTPPEEE